MTRRLTTFHPVLGEPDSARERFLGSPGDWLPRPVRAAGPGAWRLEIRFGTISHEVRCDVGAPWLGTDTVWRHVRWEPLPGRLLPTLDGELGLTVRGAEASLVLDARYDPPGHGLGTAIDAVLLHRVARHSAASFLGDLAANLEAREPSHT